MDTKSRIERINAALAENGLSYHQLADMCGDISVSTISRALSGKVEPKEFTLSSMEEALGITDRPIGDPISERMSDDPILEAYINMQEVRIARLRAHYNMLLAEKNRWIWLLFCLSLVLVTFICFILVMDVLHPNIGWIREQLGLGIDWFANKLAVFKFY